MVKAQDTIDLNSIKPLNDIADNTRQHFWYNETGVDTGAHITEVPQEEWEDSTNPNYHTGGNLLARSNGIAVRDGLTELARFGANGMQIGKDDEKHIAITSDSFNVYDEDGSLPFSVSTRGSKVTRQIGVGVALAGADSTYHTYSTYIYLRGTLVDNKVCFGTNTSVYPTDFSNYITLPTDPPSYPTDEQTITVNGINCTAYWHSNSTIRVVFDNTTNTRTNVAYRYNDSYYQTSIKVDDATLNNRLNTILLNDTVGTSIDSMCYVNVYGHVAQIHIAVYNTNSVNSGGYIYKGNIMSFIPDSSVWLHGDYSVGKPMVGQILSDGSIVVYNSTNGAITTSSGNAVYLNGTYIFK